MMYKILLAIDGLAALAIGAFFIAGTTQGWISSFNIQIWIIAGCVVGGIIALGTILHRNGRTVPANLVLALLAVPALLYCLFIALFAFSGSSWI